ncbi:GA-binding protein subunit beta-2-like protein [Lates japonicus]|uniref:GA-binding protein subunit beta-2-like protein n=1 Tax=Lates japonicus TaxID=270547 RepID=A0AAD3R230_LATJO|nr:GA-binding protein subunit beta-2-like protein [Lates japonicus]
MRWAMAGGRVITIVMDQYGNLQLAALGQQFIVTLQEQHMMALSANTITEEVVVEEPQQPRPHSHSHQHKQQCKPVVLFVL